MPYRKFLFWCRAERRSAPRQRRWPLQVCLRLRRDAQFQDRMPLYRPAARRQLVGAREMTAAMWSLSLPTTFLKVSN